MKLVSKPISSPSRLDKFPPPLMRFLRNNGGSRSRGRSRSSPIFIRRRNEPNTETQEPSSPKVTCMGQVRVRRSKKAVGKNSSGNPCGRKRPCLWIRKVLLCNSCGWKSKPRTSRSFWEIRWFVPFQVGYGRKKKSSERESKREETEEYVDIKQEEEEEEEDERDNKVFVSCSPPKNALWLMRCKSEPSRASSLAYRFWGSPSAAEVEDTEQEQTEGPKHPEEEEEEEEEDPTLRKEPNCRDSAAESRIDPENEEKFVYIRRLESSSNGTSTKLADTREGTSREEFAEEASRREIAGPLILPRCKSEPARRPEKLDLETWFWKRRLNFFEMPTTTRF